jgi:3',5'-cyclic AMP phosphodiesterase CpdA
MLDSRRPSGLVATARPKRRVRTRWVIACVLAVVLLIATVFGVQYRRQVWSYLTHWKGSPTHTVAYRPYTPPPELHVGVAGDIGDSGDRLDATGRAMAELGRSDPFDVLLLLGDNVYPSGDPKQLPETVWRPFAEVLRSADLLAIVGNHDAPHSEAQMEALGMPGRWWSRQIGDTLIVGLDTNEPDNAKQRAFLERTLASSDARWKIVALHHPPYSAGYQGSSQDARAIFSPIFEKYDVDLVLSGHDHDYQRSKKIRGVTYVVSGAAAGTRRTGTADFTAASFSWHHFVDLAIFPDRLVGRAVNQDRRVADSFVLRAPR